MLATKRKKGISVAFEAKVNQKDGKKKRKIKEEGTILLNSTEWAPPPLSPNLIFE